MILTLSEVLQIGAIYLTYLAHSRKCPIRGYFLIAGVVKDNNIVRKENSQTRSEGQTDVQSEIYFRW